MDTRRRGRTESVTRHGHRPYHSRRLHRKPSFTLLLALLVSGVVFRMVVSGTGSGSRTRSPVSSATPLEASGLFTTSLSLS